MRAATRNRMSSSTADFMATHRKCLPTVAPSVAPEQTTADNRNRGGHNMTIGFIEPPLDAWQPAPKLDVSDERS